MKFQFRVAIFYNQNISVIMKKRDQVGNDLKLEWYEKFIHMDFVERKCVVDGNVKFSIL